MESYENEETVEKTADNKTANFEYRGKTYEIRFSMKRLELYENAHAPVMTSFIKNGGAFSISELKGLLAYGLQQEGGAFVNPRFGAQMADGLVEENGYLTVYESVTDALQRDCGFLFE